MIGQEKILNVINKYSLATMPKTMLFIGPEGSGKHTLIKLLAANVYAPYVSFNEQLLKLKDLTDLSYPDLAKEVSENIITGVIPTVYVIDLSCTYMNKQIHTLLLKLIEDVPTNAYFCLTANSLLDVPPAIENRCIKHTLAPYTVEQLKQIRPCSNDLVYKVCKTPGQLIGSDDKNIVKFYNICRILPNELARTNYAKVASLSARVNYKEAYDKLDMDMFFDIILLVTSEDYLENNNLNSLKMYNFTTNYRQSIFDKVNKTGIKNLIKESFVLNYLTRLWEVMR